MAKESGGTDGPKPDEPEVQIFRLSRHGPSMRVVRALVPILERDGVVLLPTDTIYGFSGRFASQASRDRIVALKGGDRLPAMLSLISGYEMAFRYVEPPHDASRELLLRHWPGPLTAVLRARSHIPPELCGPGDTLAFRWPMSPFLQALLGAVGLPLVSTSANQSGEPTPSSFEELRGHYSTGLDAMVDGGDLTGAASTIVDLTGPEPVVLREGALKI